ncbi:hypothetical protein BJ912DRAFT_1023740 [Pholiota molesta]|nr:hypothetical protein BJ912DRAFT_1023740 [Pholiota molesta]
MPSVPSSRLSHIRAHMHSSQSPKVVLTRNLGPDVMPFLERRQDIELVVWGQDRACDREWLLEHVPGAAALIVILTDRIDAEVLDAAGPQLQVVSTMSVGYDHINVKELAKRNIKLGYTPDVLTDAVADTSIMLALMAGRNARESMTVVNEGKWPEYNWGPFLFCGRQLSASASSPTRTVGFLGFGRIAYATLARLVPFGFTHCIYTAAPPPRRRPSATPRSRRNTAWRRDVVFVLAPGGAATANLKTAVLVNTSRGTLVDSHALARALRDRWIWGAGVDVVTGEPQISADHPLVREPRCIVLPHIGSATVETRIDMATLAVKNALAVISGTEMPASLDLTS